MKARSRPFFQILEGSSSMTQYILLSFGQLYPESQSISEERGELTQYSQPVLFVLFKAVIVSEASIFVQCMPLNSSKDVSGRTI